MASWPISQYAANESCVTISPDVDLNWHQTDQLESGRSMGNVSGFTGSSDNTDAFRQMINLPDGRIFYVNGAGTGTAGYGNNS